MRTLAGVFLLIVFAAAVVSTAAAQELGWDKTYGTPSNELATCAVEATDGGADGAASSISLPDSPMPTTGGYIIAGFTHAYGAGGTVCLIKTDSTGNEMWERTFGGEDWDIMRVVHQTTDGGYIMAGTTKSFGAGDADLWLIKTDSSGNEMWSRTFGGANYDGGYDVKQTTDGGYILLGDTSSYGAGNYDLWLIKTDSFGHKTWEKFFGGTSWDFARSVWQTTDGGYIIAGDTSSYGPNEYEIWLIKTNSAGTMLWNKTFGGTLGDQAHDVQQTADGGYIVAGTTYSFGLGDNDFWLIKTNSGGTMMWNKTFGGTARDELQSVQQTADGGYIMAGTTESYGEGETDVWVIKTDANGNSIWDRTFGGTSAEEGRSVRQTTDGGYIVAGWTSSYGAGGQDMWLIKIDNTVCSEYYADYDEDGYGIASDVQCLLSPFYPYTAIVDGDCDDNESTTYPGAIEICGDGNDNDCDSHVDTEDPDCQEFLAIHLSSPANGGALYSAPTFTWTAIGGLDNRFAVDLSYDWTFSWCWSTYENMHRLIREESWTMPQRLWDFIPSGSRVYWRVRGADLESDPLVIVTSSEVWSFSKQ